MRGCLEEAGGWAVVGREMSRRAEWPSSQERLASLDSGLVWSRQALACPVLGVGGVRWLAGWS